MHRFWNAITKPLLSAMSPKTIVEIGSDRGYGTELLLEWAKSNEAQVHVFDPNPKYSVADWVEQFGDTYVPHIKISLEGLSEIESPEFVLIDGDHNWYTVLNELRTLRDSPGRFPIVLLHDVGWPYGRRDLYYDPDTIPEEDRQDFEKRPMMPGKVYLSDDSGINEHLFNAIKEGGERNGVLTAIEDFVNESADSFQVVQWPGIHALAAVFQPAQLPDGALELIEDLRPTSAAQEILQVVEDDRLALLVRLSDLRRQSDKSLPELLERIRTLVAKRSEADQAIRLLRTRLASAEADLETERGLHREGEQGLDELASRIACLERKLAEERSEGLRAAERTEFAERERDAAAAAYQEAEKRATLQLEKRRALLSRKSVRFALRSANLVYGIARLGRKQSSPEKEVSKTTERRDGNISSTRGGVNGSEKASYILDDRSRQDSPDRVTAAPTGGMVVDIVVCIHNALDDVKMCLASITANTNLVRNRLILIDDGSSVETAEFVAEFSAETGADAIRHERAQGYTRAANAGLKAGNAPYVVLLNSDTIVTPYWIETLVACATHRPNIAVVGPLSNAASWQSVPKLSSDNGGWAVNEVPPRGIQEFAEKLGLNSPRLYPKADLINGFCYFISRQAIDAVGYLDEISFPQGYGEEDDFSFRCLAAGFENVIADDCYVFHSKSKSFTPARRLDIVKQSKEALITKYGSQAIRLATTKLATSPDAIRARTMAALVHDEKFRAVAEPPDEARHLAGFKIAWASPHLGIVGGVRRKLSMANAMRRWGVDVTIVTPDGHPQDWLPSTVPVMSSEEARNQNFDLLILSDPDVLPWTEPIPRSATVVFHLAAYARYRPESAALRAFYEAMPDALHLANSNWTKDQAQKVNPGLQFGEVVPGAVDQSLFSPRPVAASYDVVCFGSRRTIKGTDVIESIAGDRSLLKIAEMKPTQRELAGLYCSGRVFVSAARHEGFNLPPLEAMACGVPVAMTDDGGSRDYAIDGSNASVVQVDDAERLVDAIRDLESDPVLYGHRIESGMRTAANYTWDRATRALVAQLGEA